VPERGNGREHRKSARDRKTDSKRQRWKADRKESQKLERRQRAQKVKKTLNVTQNQNRQNGPTPQWRQPSKTKDRPKREDQRRARDGRPKAAEGKKKFMGTHLWLNDGKSFGKWEIKRRAWRKSHFDGTLQLCRQSEEVVRVSAFRPLGFHPF
jgi:hypothetical protein